MTSAVACPRCREPVSPGALFCSRCGFDISGPQGGVSTVQIRVTGAQLERAQAELLEHLRAATLGDYDIIGELGRGGMATVYLAHDIALDRRVAIKVMHPALLTGEGMTDRFKREARTAAALTHPHIIPVHLVRETDQIVFFVMKYVHGRSLDSIIQETGPLPIRMVQAILTQVGSALSYAHRRGVVHRDVKPANIMVDDEGWAIVTDFGIAKIAEARGLTMTGGTVGTPYYMSPEQCSAKPVTGASDQYSLGIVGYEMLTGKTPFTGDSLMDIMRKHFFESPPLLLSLRPDCPRALSAAIERMLGKEPEERWPSLEAAIGAMGGQPLALDDPIRTQLMELARSGIKPVARISAPHSPTPVGRPAPTKPLGRGVPPPGRGARAGQRRGSRRLLLWGVMVAITGGVSFGIYQWIHVDSGTATRPNAIPPKPDSTAPLPETIAQLEISTASKTLEEGEQEQLSARAKNSAGNAVTSAVIQWSSNDTAVARVSAAGVVTGLRAGTVTVLATSEGRSDSVRLTVHSPMVASIEVAPSSTVMGVRKAVTLTATAKDARGNRLPGRRIAWSSSNRAIATVSENGVVTAIAAGTTTVLAASENKSTSVRITVTAQPVALLQVEPRAVRLQVSDTLRLTATPRSASGEPLGGRTVDWRSSEPGIASVTPAGVVTGLTPGAAVITAITDGGTSGGTAVTVVRPAAGILRMLIQPWANVSIDGQSRGQRDRGQDTLPSRIAHRLRFERDGFVTIDSTVTLQPGEQRLIRIQMTPRNP